jgi:4'-phosphopantetheinyl transferase
MIAIQQGEIHLWIACDEEIVDESLLLRYRQLLSAEESQKLPRFHHIRHQHQYLVSRALLRHVLSLYLGMPAVELQFRRNSFGKPFLLRPAPASLSFNLSHTDGRIALAIANEGDIGVDIESSSQSPMALEIARSHFARVEFEQLLQTPRSQQPDRFLDFWTLKEA